MKQMLRDIARLMKKIWPAGLVMSVLHMLAGIPWWIAMIAGLIEVGLWSVLFVIVYNAIESFESGRLMDALKPTPVPVPAQAMSPEAAYEAAANAA